MPATIITPDEYFIGVGRVIQNCILTEFCMYKALQVISGCPEKVAVAILYTFDALPGRQQLLTRVAEVSCNDDDKATIQRINDAAKKANDQRKQLAHSSLAYDPDPGVPLKRFNPKSGQFHVVSEDSMRVMVTATTDAVRAGFTAIDELCTKHGLSTQFNFD
jgi:hypothetical protein